MFNNFLIFSWNSLKYVCIITSSKYNLYSAEKSYTHLTRKKNVYENCDIRKPMHRHSIRIHFKLFIIIYALKLNESESLGRLTCYKRLISISISMIKSKMDPRWIRWIHQMNYKILFKTRKNSLIGTKIVYFKYYIISYHNII